MEIFTPIFLSHTIIIVLLAKPIIILFYQKTKITPAYKTYNIRSFLQNLLNHERIILMIGVSS